jgi:glycerol kinase
MDRYVLAIDQGTTGTTVLLLDRTGTCVGRAYSEFRQIYPQPGWVEHDPEEIWEVTAGVIDKAVSSSGIHPSKIAAVGITNQRETTGFSGTARTGRPVHNAIVWQCPQDRADLRGPEKAGARALVSGKNRPGRRCLFLRNKASVAARSRGGRF